MILYGTQCGRVMAWDVREEALSPSKESPSHSSDSPSPSPSPSLSPHYAAPKYSWMSAGRPKPAASSFLTRKTSSNDDPSMMMSNIVSVSESPSRSASSLSADVYHFASPVTACASRWEDSFVIAAAMDGTLVRSDVRKWR